MTAVVEEQPAAEATPSAPEAPPPRVIPLRKVIVITVLAGIALLAGWWVLEDPVAHVWYTARQQHLASQFQRYRIATKPGQALSVVQIPSVGLNLVVAQGDSAAQLRGGPGHDPATPAPGQRGNSVVYGHRQGWGAPFSALGKVAAGDALYVQTWEGSTRRTTRLTITSVRRGASATRRLLLPTSDTRLTLVTGDGGRLSSSRLVVTAVAGRQLPPRTNVKAAPGPSAGSPLFNRTVGSFFLRAAAVAAVIALMRRRFRPLTTAIVVTPIALAALLALLLDLDLFLAVLG